MTTDLAETLGRQETAALEFKREAKDRHAIRKAICALANDLPGLGGPARPMVPWAAHRPSCSGAESTLMS